MPDSERGDGEGSGGGGVGGGGGGGVRGCEGRGGGGVPASGLSINIRMVPAQCTLKHTVFLATD